MSLKRFPACLMRLPFVVRVISKLFSFLIAFQMYLSVKGLLVVASDTCLWALFSPSFCDSTMEHSHGRSAFLPNGSETFFAYYIFAMTHLP